MNKIDTRKTIGKINKTKIWWCCFLVLGLFGFFFEKMDKTEKLSVRLRKKKDANK